MVTVAITAPDILDSGASGFGLRAVGLGRALAETYSVDILAPGNPGLDTGAAMFLHGEPGQHRAIRHADFVVTANAVPRRLLPRVRGNLVFDLYDPNVIEAITIQALHSQVPQASLGGQLWSLRYALRHGTYGLCANEAQKDLYTGMLLGLDLGGRSLTVTEEALRHKFLVVPNGVDPSPLPDRRRSRQRLGFSPEDVVLLWGGGVWDWLDPETVVKAVALASASVPSLRLVFLGLRRGGSHNPNATKGEQVWSYARDAGLLGGAVRINEDWVGLDERGAYLAASDAGVMGQGDHLESRYSFRTRFMDCLWAGIPVLVTGSDPLTEEGVTEGWALRCPTGDVGGLAQLLVKFARDGSWRSDLCSAAERGRDLRTWDRVVLPLVEAIDRAPGVATSQRIRRSLAATGAGARNQIRSLLTHAGGAS